jgi:FtsZ-binding cell division protein ZapB
MMSDDEKLFALMAIAEEQQASAQRAIEGMAAEREKLAKQREAMAKLIRELAYTSERAAGAMEKAAGTALQDAADKSVVLVAQAVAEAFKRTFAPAVKNLSNIVDSAAGAERQIRSALAGFSWRSMLMVSSIVMGALLGVWFTGMVSISWQRYQIDRLSDQRRSLEDEVQALQAQSNDLAKRGGRIKLKSCGEHMRLCAEVELEMRYGERGEYFVLKGY